jgi:hypothetical protein
MPQRRHPPLPGDHAKSGRALLLLARYTAWSYRSATEHKRHAATPAQPWLPPLPTNCPATYDVTDLPTRLDPSRSRRPPERVLLAGDPSEDLLAGLLRPLQVEEVNQHLLRRPCGPRAEVPFAPRTSSTPMRPSALPCRYSVGCWACCQAARPSVRNSVGMEQAWHVSGLTCWFIVESPAGIEPATPSLPSRRGGFTTPCNTLVAT